MYWDRKHWKSRSMTTNEEYSLGHAEFEVL